MFAAHITNETDQIFLNHHPGQSQLQIPNIILVHLSQTNDIVMRHSLIPATRSGVRSRRTNGMIFCQRLYPRPQQHTYSHTFHHLPCIPVCRSDQSYCSHSTFVVPTHNERHILLPLSWFPFTPRTQYTIPSIPTSNSSAPPTYLPREHSL